MLHIEIGRGVELKLGFNTLLVSPSFSGERNNKNGRLTMTMWRIGLMVLMGLSLCVGVFADSEPEVTHVTATPRADGSGIVDIAYTLNGPEDGKWNIAVQVSVDGGSSWGITPSWFTLSGDVGPIGPGIRHITWDSKIDLPWAFGTNYRIKVIANSTTADLVVIPAGSFQMGDSKSEGDSVELPTHNVTLDSFAMGKYEITNGQYCAFLNSARTQGLITVTNNVVYQAGSGTSHRHDGRRICTGGFVYQL